MSGMRLKQYLESVRTLYTNREVTRFNGPYLCMEDLVLDRGTWFTPRRLTPEQNEYVRFLMDMSGCAFRMRECFRNAQMLVITDPAGRLQYVEGFALGGFFPTLHGWVTIDDRPVEVTWTDEGTEPVISPPAEWEYIGLVFSRADVLDRALFNNRECISFIDNWEQRWPLLQQERLAPLSQGMEP